MEINCPGDENCPLEVPIDVKSASSVCAWLLFLMTMVSGIASLSLAKFPGVETWIHLNIVQEMRVWVLLGGVKSVALYDFFTSDFGFVSLNFPYA